MACASLMRMPEGRLSSTSLKMLLYSATALDLLGFVERRFDTDEPRCLVHRWSALTRASADGIDRQLAQAAREEPGHTTRIAGHIAAQADLAPGSSAIVHNCA